MCARVIVRRSYSVRWSQCAAPAVCKSCSARESRCRGVAVASYGGVVAVLAGCSMGITM